MNDFLGPFQLSIHLYYQQDVDGRIRERKLVGLFARFFLHFTLQK